MFGKVPEDSFQSIFDLSFDSEDSKSHRSLDLFSQLSPSGINNCSINKNNANESWRSVILNSPNESESEELEHAFAKLYSGDRRSSVQDVFASSFFPFTLNSLSSEKSKTCDTILDNSISRTGHQQQLLSSASSTCSTSSTRSSPAAASAPLPANKVNSSRYKTELCRPFQENGSCKYGEKCQFAHGPQELRTVNRHPKYKTDLCRTYHSVGFCPYGPRCHFIHSLDEATNKQKPASGTTSPNDIAAAISALKQLPMFTPERVSAPPGFPQRPRLDGMPLVGSSDSSGISSACSLSPSLISDHDDSIEGGPRLPVFSRMSH